MKRFELVAGIGSMLLVASCAATKPEPLPPPTVSVSEAKGEGTGMKESTTTVTARVEAIDQKTRMVTLKGSDGKTVTFRASDDVKNLPQVKRGDLVNVVYYESLAYEVRKKGQGKTGATATTDVATAPLGEMPAAVGARTVTLTAKVTGIDRKTNTVTLKGPKGKSVAVKVKDPSRLEGVKVGDLVDITYSEALGISVEEAPKS